MKIRDEEPAARIAEDRPSPVADAAIALGGNLPVVRDCSDADPCETRVASERRP
jgi:hypothetical protein